MKATQAAGPRKPNNLEAHTALHTLGTMVQMQMALDQVSGVDDLAREWERKRLDSSEKLYPPHVMPKLEYLEKGDDHVESSKQKTELLSYNTAHTSGQQESVQGVLRTATWTYRPTAVGFSSDGLPGVPLERARAALEAFQEIVGANAGKTLVFGDKIVIHGGWGQGARSPPLCAPRSLHVLLPVCCAVCVT